jgi:hypothetical protein
MTNRRGRKKNTGDKRRREIVKDNNILSVQFVREFSAIEEKQNSKDGTGI